MRKMFLQMSRTVSISSPVLPLWNYFLRYHTIVVEKVTFSYSFDSEFTAWFIIESNYEHVICLSSVYGLVCHSTV